MSGQLHALTALSPEEKSPVFIGYDSGLAKSRSGRSNKRYALLGVEPRASNK